MSADSSEYFAYNQYMHKLCNFIQDNTYKQVKLAYLLASHLFLLGTGENHQKVSSVNRHF